MCRLLMCGCPFGEQAQFAFDLCVGVPKQLSFRSAELLGSTWQYSCGTLWSHLFELCNALRDVRREGRVLFLYSL